MGIIDGDPSKYLPRDSYGAFISIDQTHHKIHAGLTFSGIAYQTGGSAMNVLITAPSAVHYHFIAGLSANGPGTITWSRTPNFDSTGATVITGYNHNEDSANVTTLTHALGGIWASSGTILNQWIIGAATGAGSLTLVGGDAAHDDEWELGYDSVHLFRFVPTASCESVMSLSYYRKE